MEELFEVIVALIVIVASLVKTVGKSKKIRDNAPGKAAAPEKPAAPAKQAEEAQPVLNRQYARPVPVQPTVHTTVRPTEKPAEIPDLWQQMSKRFGEQAEAMKRDEGHEAVVKMVEGDSRECEHGSIGGSMAYEAHQEGGEKKAVKPRPAAAKPVSAYRPVMNAQEMRRAVVMAEILKRPQERMAEQTRRWSVR